MNPKRKWTENDFDFIKSNRHLSNKNLSEILNLPISVISNIRHRFRLLKHKRLVQTEKDNILSLAKTKIEISIIAERLNLPYGKVYFFLRKNS